MNAPTSRTTCGYVKPDYYLIPHHETVQTLSPLTCDLQVGHDGYHWSAEDGMGFGPFRASTDPAEVTA